MTVNIIIGEEKKHRRKTEIGRKRKKAGKMRRRGNSVDTNKGKKIRRRRII